MFKCILFFIGLKIVEIGAIVFIPYWVGVPVNKFINKVAGLDEDTPKFLEWFMGMVTIIALVMLGLFLEWLFKVNWSFVVRHS